MFLWEIDWKTSKSLQFLEIIPSSPNLRLLRRCEFHFTRCDTTSLWDYSVSCLVIILTSRTICYNMCHFFPNISPFKGISYSHYLHSNCSHLTYVLWIYVCNCHSMKWWKYLSLWNVGFSYKISKKWLKSLTTTKDWSCRKK